MKIVDVQGNPELAQVFIAELEDGHKIEFVESIQPPRTRHDKWVNIISTMVGCPVGCRMCDAGGGFSRHLTSSELHQQLSVLLEETFPQGIDTKYWKIQLARMGEPTLNPAVLDFLEQLGSMGHGNLSISLSTVAPATCGPFIQKLRAVKDEHFPGKFQLQFSIHSTDNESRSRLIPIKSLALPEIAALGRQFRDRGDKKITLNFIVMKDVPIDIERISRIFDTENFLIKLTPLNPTYRARYHKILPGFDASQPGTARRLVERFESAGFETILSIGELEENQIGSNCGQYLTGKA